MNQSADEMDIDVSVDPTRGVTIVIENETVYVTSRAVTIGWIFMLGKKPLNANIILELSFNPYSRQGAINNV